MARNPEAEEFGPVVKSMTMPGRTDKDKPDEHLKQGIVIPKGSKMSWIGAGYKVRFGTPVYEITIGIGKDNHACLLIDEEAYAALLAGAKITISH